MQTAHARPPVEIAWLGEQPFTETWQTMQHWSQTRTAATPDQIWLLTHPSVYTQGLNGQPQHLSTQALSGPIPIVNTDRGGQVTYHGPGQLIGYCLFDLKRAGCGVKTLVQAIETSIQTQLQQWALPAHFRAKAPGVYLNEAKVAALGLKVKHQCTYHGFSLNIDMDLTPFEAITPCGLAHTPVTQLADWLPLAPEPHSTGLKIAKTLVQTLGLPSELAKADPWPIIEQIQTFTRNYSDDNP